MTRRLSLLWLFLSPLVSALSQEHLYLSTQVGKYFFPVEKGFALGTRYNPYRTTPISNNDFDFELMCYCHKWTRILSKQVQFGYAINSQTTLGLLFSADKVYFAIPCSYAIEHFSYIWGAFAGKTMLLNSSGTIQFMQSVEILYRDGRSKVYEYAPIVSWDELDSCSQTGTQPPPDLRVTALGTGYSASLHLRIWKSLYAVLNGQIALFFLGKNAGFQPLQLHLMIGLAWKPRLKHPNEAGN